MINPELWLVSLPGECSLSLQITHCYHWSKQQEQLLLQESVHQWQLVWWDTLCYCLHSHDHDDTLSDEHSPVKCSSHITMSCWWSEAVSSCELLLSSLQQHQLCSLRSCCDDLVQTPVDTRCCSWSHSDRFNIVTCYLLTEQLFLFSICFFNMTQYDGNSFSERLITYVSCMTRELIGHLIVYSF